MGTAHHGGWESLSPRPPAWQAWRLAPLGGGMLRWSAQSCGPRRQSWRRMAVGSPGQVGCVLLCRRDRRHGKPGGLLHLVVADGVWGARTGGLCVALPARPPAWQAWRLAPLGGGGWCLGSPDRWAVCCSVGATAGMASLAACSTGTAGVAGVAASSTWRRDVEVERGPRGPRPWERLGRYGCFLIDFIEFWSDLSLMTLFPKLHFCCMLLNAGSLYEARQVWTGFESMETGKRPVCSTIRGK